RAPLAGKQVIVDRRLHAYLAARRAVADRRRRTRPVVPAPLIRQEHAALCDTPGYGLRELPLRSEWWRTAQRVRILVREEPPRARARAERRVQGPRSHEQGGRNVPALLRCELAPDGARRRRA